MPKTNSFLTVPHVTCPHQTPLPRLRATSPPAATRGPRRPTRAKTRIGCRASVTPPPCGHDACSPAKCPEHRGVRVRHHALRRSVAEYCHELLHAVNAGRHGDLLRTFYLWNVSSAGAGAEEVNVKRLAVFTDHRLAGRLISSRCRACRRARSGGRRAHPQAGVPLPARL